MLRNGTRRRRSLATAAKLAAASTLVLSAHGFSTVFPLHQHPCRQKPITSTQRRAISDPVALLNSDLEAFSRFAKSLESAYEDSPDLEEPRYEESLGDDDDNPDVEESDVSEILAIDHMQLAENHSTSGRKRALLSKPSLENFNIPVPDTTNIKEAQTTPPDSPKKKKEKPLPSSRSSTMEGFREFTTNNQRAFIDGIKFAEMKTGKSLSKLYSKEALKTRKRVQGEAMYKNAVSVPDSLVDFARELHQVS